MSLWSDYEADYAFPHGVNNRCGSYPKHNLRCRAAERGCL